MSSATSHLYIQSWIGSSNIESLVLKTEKEIIKYGQPYTVINSTNNIYDKPNWVNSGDHWYYISFYRALQEFNQQADYFIYATGDISCDNWSVLLDRMYSVIDNTLGSYSPYTKNSIMTPKRVGFKKLDGYLDYSICQDGLWVAYRKDIAQELLEFFDFVVKEIDLYKFKYGWGIDFIAAVMCMRKGLYMLKDKFIKTSNESSKFYETPEVALNELHTILDLYVKFKGNEVKPLLDKVLSRMEDMPPGYKKTSHLTFEDFYA